MLFNVRHFKVHLKVVTQYRKGVGFTALGFLFGGGVSVGMNSAYSMAYSR